MRLVAPRCPRLNHLARAAWHAAARDRAVSDDRKAVHDDWHRYHRARAAEYPR